MNTTIMSALTGDLVAVETGSQVFKPTEALTGVDFAALLGQIQGSLAEPEAGADNTAGAAALGADTGSPGAEGDPAMLLTTALSSAALPAPQAATDDSAEVVAALASGEVDSAALEADADVGASDVLLASQQTAATREVPQQRPPGIELFVPVTPRSVAAWAQLSSSAAVATQQQKSSASYVVTPSDAEGAPQSVAFASTLLGEGVEATATGASKPAITVDDVVIEVPLARPQAAGVATSTPSVQAEDAAHSGKAASAAPLSADEVADIPDLLQNAPALEVGKPTPAKELIARQGIVLAESALLARATAATEAATTERIADDVRPQTNGLATLSGTTPRVETQGEVRGAFALQSADAAIETVSLQELNGVLVKHARLQGAGEQRTMTLRLVPESLGELQVELKSNGHEISVRMASANASVRDALEVHAHALRESLGRDGMEVSKIEIGSQLNSNHGQTHGGNAFNREAQQGWQERPRFNLASFQSDSPAAVATTAYARRAVHSGSLNLFV